MTGRQIGPYKILVRLGGGGMGEVYRARDMRLARDVVIKVLLPAYASDADRLRRFENEARAASSLNHPNILAIHDVGTADGSPYLVSELLEGETMRETIGGRPLPPARAIDYALQVAGALAAAHEKGIVHRDLKPENLFVTGDGRVKILDFGFTRLARPEQPGSNPGGSMIATEPAISMATVAYMAPEQIRGQAADHRADVFSFGAILFEMLTGRRAFSGASAVETMNAILTAAPPDLPSDTGIDPAVGRVVGRCLEKSPDARFQSARDLTSALKEASATTPSGPSVRLAAPRIRRIGRGAAAGGVALLLVLLAASFAFRCG